MSNQIILKSTLSSTGVQLIQDAKSGMFNVSEMFDSANEVLGTNRQIKHYLESKGCKELFRYRVNLLKSHQPKIGDADNQQLIKEEKSIEDSVLKVYRGRVTKDGRTKNKIMADPVMTLDAASYLDVALKNEVYEYYLDNKANERNKMTSNYKKFCSVLSRNIANTKDIFEDTCKRINGIVFDKFVGGLWNDECTKEQYIELNDILVRLTTLIEDGDINTLSSMRKRLDKWYLKKYGNTIQKAEVIKE